MRQRRRFTVERLESRNTPSAMTLSSGALAASALIRGYEDSNLFRSIEDPNIRCVDDPNQVYPALLPAIQSPAAAVECPSDPTRR